MKMPSECMTLSPLDPTSSSVPMTKSLCATVESSAETLGLVSNEMWKIVELVLFVILIAATCLFGMVTNIINIIIFFKQGLNDTVNIGLFALAISDFCAVISLEWISTCLNPLVADSGLPWDTRQMFYLTGAWPHICSGRISCCITAYITAERCLCIALPMRVKQIITPKRTTIIISTTYIINILTTIPAYMASYLGWAFLPERNKTMITVIFRENGAELDAFGFGLSGVATIIPFPLVIIFTVILVIRLKRQSNWRMKSSHDSKQSELSTRRDSRTMHMVVMVACILIVCYTPGIISSVGVFLAPSFSITGVNVNLFYVVWSFVSFMQALNSSVNIFVYYNMSTKYRQTFHAMFKL